MKNMRSLMNKVMLLTLVSSHLVGAFPVIVQAVENKTTSEETVETPASSESSLQSVTQTSVSTSESNVQTTQETSDATASTSETNANATTSQTTVSDSEIENNTTSETTETTATSESETSESEVMEEGSSVPVQILGINDFHGAIATTGSAYLDTKISNAGKAAYLASELDAAQASFESENQAGSTIRIQAGDLVGASPSNSALLQDEPSIKIANRLNISLGILGNHEFDEGLAEFNRILLGEQPLAGSVQDTEIIRNYPKEASNTQILSANVFDANGNIPFGFEPYAIKEMNGVKVGFIGVVTDQVPNLVLAQHVKDYTFVDPAQAIVENAEKLRDQGVNAIVVIGHTGGAGVESDFGGETAEIISRANTLDPDNSVDVYFAGHSHSYANADYEGVRVVQGTSQGKAISNVIGEVDVDTQDFVDVPTGEIIPVLNDESTPTSNLTPNADIQAIVEDADQRIEGMVNEVIGKTSDGQAISRDVNDDNAQESALGNLITDGQLSAARQSFADQDLTIDFAMTNNGGIRADLAVNDQGEITWGAAQAVQPFGNVMQVVSIKGTDLLEALNQQFTQNYFLQIAGMQYTFTGEVTKDAGGNTVSDTRKIKEITVIDEAGKKSKFDETATYHVVINDFLFGGGDGFSAFTKAELIGALDPDTDIFVNYIKEQGTVSAKVEGRKEQASTAGEQTLTILGTTDVHGNIWDFSYEDSAEAANGLAKVSGYANEVRQAEGAENVVLVDNGDVVQGTILTDDLYNTNAELLKEEHPIIKAMNVMGYDSMTLGNHEFNFGTDLIKKMQAEANFPLLSANTYFKDSGENFVDAYTITEKNGVKVAILGLTIPDIPLWDGPRVTELAFNGLQEEAEKQVAMIEEKEQPDVIIASIHAGLENSNEASAAINVIENVTAIDAFIVGHDHKTIATKIKDVAGNEKPVGASTDTGSELTRINLDMTYNEATQQWEIKDSDVAAIDLAEVPADEAVKEATKEAHEKTLDYISQEIGRASANFLPEQAVPGIPEAQMQPTALISLINNVQLEATGADVSTASLFKADSELNAGGITYANIFDIYKYANTLVGVTITGSNLKAYMEDSARYYNQYQEGDLTVSFGGTGSADEKIRVYNYDMFAGIDYQIDVSKPVGERIVAATINGKAIEDTKEYKLAVNNYRLGNLISNNWVSEADVYFNTDPETLRGMIAAYITEKEVIDPQTELSDNWEIVGASGLTHFLRPVMIQGVKDGKLTIEATPNNRTPNITTLTIQDLIDADLVGKLDLADLTKVVTEASQLNNQDLATLLADTTRVLTDATALNEQLGEVRADEGQAQAIIDAYTKTLKDALINGTVALDLIDLEGAVTEAQAKEESDFEVAAWQDFTPVRDEAVKVLAAAVQQNEQGLAKASSVFSFVLGEEPLTQDDIQEVATTLTAAMTELEKHAVTSGGGNTGNDNNGAGSSHGSGNTNTGKLPQTGEEKAAYAGVGIVIVLGTSTVLYMNKKRKAKV